MIQLQAINNIIENNNIELYLNAGLTAEHFLYYKEHFNYILEHYNKYDKAPDLSTFLMEFPDFEVVDVYEPVDYLIKNLFEEYLYEKGVQLFEKSARMLENNSYEGLQYIINKGEELLNQNVTEEITDINQLAELKEKDIDNKRNSDGLLGISTGLKELDKVLMGWQPGEELVTIVGRVNQGKSWLLQKFLSAAHQQGKRVLLYSGEMSVLQVAYRNDTLSYNFSNRQLMFGTISDSDYSLYQETLKDAENKLNPYYVVTPKDLGGKWLDVPTLKTLIKKYKPDIVGIDQLSLMTDAKHAREKRIQLSNITMDLFNLSQEFGIPILADAQANRNKSDMENPENPELADLAESDAIGQNSSRVISLVQTKNGLSLKITKNRYGANNDKFIYSWDIDNGTFRYTNIEENDYTEQGEEVQLKPRNSRKRSLNKTDNF